ncbi:MAG: aminodeoxychorismate/anthranilate synthase component II [Anaerofustis sp.]
MIFMIDNYDSFTYNLVQYIEALGYRVEVVRNNEVTAEQIVEKRPQSIVISPGPCTPNEAGVSLDAVKKLKGIIPILGICLGHQTIGQAFGAKVVKAQKPMHGKIDAVTHNNHGVFRGLKNPLNVTRYHSLILEKTSLPDCFEITCESSNGEIMGIAHKQYPIEGIQFHPEAILTEMGMELLDNFFSKYGGRACIN